MLLRAGQFQFSFPRQTLVMGIVNVTPDSFSDGGKYVATQAAVEHALRLVQEGAEIIDVGGESTRPGAEPVSEEEELKRVLPVIGALAGRIKVPISIDTMKPNVARAAVESGASIVNDVAANRDDDDMWRVVSQARAGYVCMHMQGLPKTMQAKPAYEDVRREVGGFFFERIERMRHCGVSGEQLILDPGIGFGKTLEHNVELLSGLGSFSRFERPLMVGVSRKSFLGKLLGAELGARLPAALACACLAVQSGVHIIRTHDVAETTQAVRMTEAILARQHK
jgi:dihydropteroate synthase